MATHEEVGSIGSLEGKLAAIFSALGLATGCVIHALLAGIGVTASVAEFALNSYL